jgi:hypothetical protein
LASFFARKASLSGSVSKIQAALPNYTEARKGNEKTPAFHCFRFLLQDTCQRNDTLSAFLALSAVIAASGFVIRSRVAELNPSRKLKVRS